MRREFIACAAALAAALFTVSANAQPTFGRAPQTAIPNAWEQTTVILSADTATISRGAHAIAAESGTADDLCTVVTTNLLVGHSTVIQADTGDTITVKNGGACNITTDTGADILMSGVDRVTLYKTASGVVASRGGGSGKSEVVSDKAALAALTAPQVAAIKAVVVADADYGGVFRVVASDISTEVAADPAGAVYVPFSGGNGSTGGFVRQFYGPYEASWYGASPAASASVNGTALTRWLTACAGKECRIGSGTFTTDQVFQPGKSSIIYAGGSWFGLRDTWSPTSGESNATVIRGDGTTLTGANSTVGKFSIPAVGTDFASSADNGDELRDVTIVGGIHFDANGADYAAVYYRIHNLGGDPITHSGANVAGFGMWGVFEQAQPLRFGTFLNDGVGCIIGVNGPNTSYSTNEEPVYNVELYLNSVRNGQDNSYVKGSGTDQNGAGCIYAAGRGSKLVYSSEKNIGRTLVVKKSTGLGAVDIVQKYGEGNKDGVIFDEYQANYQSITFKGDFNHPGNGVENYVYTLSDGATTVYTITGGAGLTVNDIGVYVAGVKLTPTTQYTVADNVGDLDVTLTATPTADDVIFVKDYSGANAPLDITINATSTDGGPAKSGAWIKIEDMQPHTTTTTGGIAVHSNTYKFRMRDTPRGFVAYTNRNATPEGVYASGYFTWSGTTIAKRSDADYVGGVTPTYQTAGVVRLVFPPELYVRGPSTVASNYMLDVTVGNGSFRYFLRPGTYAAGYVEVRCFDFSDAISPDITATNPSTQTVLAKFTLTRIDN